MQLQIRPPVISASLKGGGGLAVCRCCFFCMGLYEGWEEWVGGWMGGGMDGRGKNGSGEEWEGGGMGGGRNGKSRVE